MVIVIIFTERQFRGFGFHSIEIARKPALCISSSLLSEEGFRTMNGFKFTLPFAKHRELWATKIIRRLASLVYA